MPRGEKILTLLGAVAGFLLGVVVPAEEPGFATRLNRQDPRARRELGGGAGAGGAHARRLPGRPGANARVPALAQGADARESGACYQSRRWPEPSIRITLRQILSANPCLATRTR